MLNESIWFLQRHCTLQTTRQTTPQILVQLNLFIIPFELALTPETLPGKPFSQCATAHAEVFLKKKGVHEKNLSTLVWRKERELWTDLKKTKCLKPVTKQLLVQIITREVSRLGARGRWKFLCIIKLGSSEPTWAERPEKTSRLAESSRLVFSYLIFDSDWLTKLERFRLRFWLATKIIFRF